MNVFFSMYGCIMNFFFVWMYSFLYIDVLWMYSVGRMIMNVFFFFVFQDIEKCTLKMH